MAAGKGEEFEVQAHTASRWSARFLSRTALSRRLHWLRVARWSHMELVSAERCTELQAAPSVLVLARLCMALLAAPSSLVLEQLRMALQAAPSWSASLFPPHPGSCMGMTVPLVALLCHPRRMALEVLHHKEARDSHRKEQLAGGRMEGQIWHRRLSYWKWMTHHRRLVERRV